MNYILELEDIGIITYILKLLFTSVFSYQMSLRIINKRDKFNYKTIMIYVLIFGITVICGIIKYEIGLFGCILVLIMLLSAILSKSINKSIGYALLIMTISLSINYIMLLISTAISFIPITIFKIEKIYISFIFIIVIYTFIFNKAIRIRRFKNGFAFLQKNMEDEYWDILILNLSVTVLFTIIIMSNYKRDITINVVLSLIIFAIIMFITIQKSLQLYYKQKLLVQELNETKEELENTKKDLKQVEEENLNFSKKSHTLAHKQKSLEHKLQQLTAKAEITTEEAGEVKDRLKEIEKDLYKDAEAVELNKTGISEIDDMLEYMQSECKKNKIDLDLQISGNIYHMTNNLINKEDLEILLADHIKDAIIAINHSDNVNRSILVRLGEIDGIYSLYIYDSGIEFEKETLENLGKKPITTHSDEGGTGMGFLNTFDTLRKYEASLIINEMSKPNKDNYTKAIIIKFDKKNEFKIISYRQEECKDI